MSTVCCTTLGESLLGLDRLLLSELTIDLLQDGRVPVQSVVVTKTTSGWQVWVTLGCIVAFHGVGESEATALWKLPPLLPMVYITQPLTAF